MSESVHKKGLRPRIIAARVPKTSVCVRVHIRPVVESGDLTHGFFVNEDKFSTVSDWLHCAILDSQNRETWLEWDFQEGKWNDLLWNGVCGLVLFQLIPANQVNREQELSGIRLGLYKVFPNRFEFAENATILSTGGSVNLLSFQTSKEDSGIVLKRFFPVADPAQKHGDVPKLGLKNFNNPELVSRRNIARERENKLWSKRSDEALATLMREYGV